MRRKQEVITGADAKQRIITYTAQMRSDYDQLWQRYRQVVHECAELHAENHELRAIMNRQHA
ncbi:MAG: hypothetical protein IIZ12_08145 [Eggerthellaceae bacterium]|nr:hypothetical protein [Eggerthellaceae bacterium]